MFSSASNRIGQLRSRPAVRMPTVCVVDPRAEDYADWESPNRTGELRLMIVRTAAEALRVAQTQGVDLWVVNSDLPGLSGCELCGMLKAHDGRTSVYLVTDQYSPEVERAALQARATLFGCKPEHGVWLEQWLGQRKAKYPPITARPPRAA